MPLSDGLALIAIAWLLGSLAPCLLDSLAPWLLGLLASRLNRDRRFNARIRIVADQLDVFVPKVG
jgi:hypothetical protein